MNFVAAALTELARNNRLFIGICAKTARLTNYDLDAKSYAYVKVVPGDVAEGLAATPWTTGLTWKVARPGVPSSQTVAVNSTGQVFACVRAMEHASSVEPTIVSGPEVATADGYIWRYLFAVPDPVSEKFVWAAGVPVRALPAPYVSTFETDGLPALPIATPRVTLFPPRTSVTPYAIKDVSDVVKAVMVPPNQLFYKGRQYAKVEDSAAAGSGAVITTNILPGGEVGLAVVDQGSGYAEARITIMGDGSGAEFAANISAGKIVGFTVVSPGSGYTEAVAVVTAGENSGVVEALYPDFAVDFTRDVALLAKAIPAIDPAGDIDLSAHLFISDEPCTDSRIRGTLGSMSVGVAKTTSMSYLTSLGVDGQYSLRQNMQINTVVQTG